MSPAQGSKLTTAFFVLLAAGALAPMVVGQAKFPQ